MRVLIALDINDADLAEDAAVTFADVRDALGARLEEFYPGFGAIRGRLLAAADVTDSYRLAVDALEVGVDGIDADDDLRELVGFTQEQVEQARQAMVALSEPVALGLV